jgi:hypothetical protein
MMQLYFVFLLGVSTFCCGILIPSIIDNDFLSGKLSHKKIRIYLGPVNTCFASTTMTDFSRNKAGAAQQSKLCKRQVTTGRVKFRPVPQGCARKNASAALQSLAIGPLCPVLRALPSRFFAQQRGRETSVNRP